MFRVQIDKKSRFGLVAAIVGGVFEEIYDEEMEDFDQAYKNLESTHRQLVKKLEEMKVLRDGVCLFRYVNPFITRFPS
jgi:hypothetical protein